MSFRVRAARSEDFQAIYEMAKLTGGGFTNLQADKGTLVANLARSEEAFSRDEEGGEGDLFVFVAAVMGGVGVHFLQAPRWTLALLLLAFAVFAAIVGTTSSVASQLS